MLFFIIVSLFAIVLLIKLVNPDLIDSNLTMYMAVFVLSIVS